MSDFTVGAVITVPLARAAGLNHLKQAVGQPSVGSVELDTGKRVPRGKIWENRIWLTLTVLCCQWEYSRKLLQMNLLVQVFP